MLPHAQCSLLLLGSETETKSSSQRSLGRISTDVSNLDQHYEPAPKRRVGQPPSTRRVSMPATKSGGSKRGFAAMDPAKQREIASKGGKASHGGGRKASSSR
jgi:hypothetical protein